MVDLSTYNVPFSPFRNFAHAPFPLQQFVEEVREITDLEKCECRGRIAKTAIPQSKQRARFY
ncbi:MULTISPECIES: hypothetical protein [unclassified Mycobacterium]|uniref:hypothetical protein n=1 Tax=unclassified Mycobacterium TaxID=2642494 RepID=UPI000ADB43AE|nr:MULTISPECIES: hypothetical protein [unclassified Mycobacterium]